MQIVFNITKRKNGKSLNFEKIKNKFLSLAHNFNEIFLEKIKNMELTIIQSKIYEIRNCKVMLDFDLAEMYQVETRVLKQAVRRNIDRFPDDFMFRLSKEEANILINTGVSQNVIPKGYNSGGADIFAFTESGVAMLSSVLRSNTAIKMNINIMRAFVAVRQLI